MHIREDQQSQNWVFKKNNKTERPLARPIKTKRGKAQTLSGIKFTIDL